MLIKLYFIALSAFLAIDMLWLGLLAKNFYRQQIGFLMKSEFNWFTAAIFYLIFVTGLVLLVIIPSVEKRSLMHALVYGALLGLVAYSAYDLTNLATLKDWPILVSVIDIAWGATVSAAVSAITYLVAIRLGL